jgi:hypothetical protein
MKTHMAASSIVALLLACGALVARPGVAAAGSPEPGQRAADADVGYLDIASDPPGATILIDDRDTGKTTPQPKLALPAGHHKLTLVRPGGTRRSIGFKVEAGQTTKLTIHLAS